MTKPRIRPLSLLTFLTLLTLLLGAFPAFAQTGSISGILWDDIDNDGLQDAGEPALVGVHARLTRVADLSLIPLPVELALTDANGAYTFPNKAADDYRISITTSQLPANYVPTYDADGTATPNQVIVQLAAGQNATGIDFGFRDGSGNTGPSSISGRVWEDLDGNGYLDSGIRYTKIDLYRFENGIYVFQSRAEADLYGYYSFSLLSAGTYKTKIYTQMASWYPIWDFDDPAHSYLGINTPEEAVLTIGTGIDATGIDFGYQRYGEIQTRWWKDNDGDGVEDSDEPGLRDITIYLENLVGGTYTLYGTYQTNSIGLVIIEDVHAGQFRIRADAADVAGYIATYDPDGIATPNLAEFFLEPGEREIQIDFGFEPDVPTAGMVGHWPFDEGIGNTAYDATLQGYDGTLMGDTTWATGASGQSLTFDGAGDSLEFMTTPLLSSPTKVSISAWVRHDETTGWRSIVDLRDNAHDGYALYLNPDGYAHFQLNQHNIVGYTELDDGQWHHVVGVYRGDRLHLYVDGAVDAQSVVIPTATISVNNTLRIGADFGVNLSVFAGEIDNVRIYDRSLTVAEVGLLYQHGS